MQAGVSQNTSFSLLHSSASVNSRTQDVEALQSLMPSKQKAFLAVGPQVGAQVLTQSCHYPGKDTSNQESTGCSESGVWGNTQLVSPTEHLNDLPRTSEK